VDFEARGGFVKLWITEFVVVDEVHQFKDGEVLALGEPNKSVEGDWIAFVGEGLDEEELEEIWRAVKEKRDDVVRLVS